MGSLFVNKMGNLKFKVCGMREEQNIADVMGLAPDFMGLIFYPKSSRYVGDNPSPHLCESYFPILKVGVFVNEDVSVVFDKCRTYRLDVVQLHGDESVDYCLSLKNKGIGIIKAFGISGQSDFEKCKTYVSVCDAFLFDTKSAGFGGAGLKFDWRLLNGYNQTVPFFLSGGISERDVDEIKSLHHPSLMGIDLNSCFELAPALKDVSRLKCMIEKIRK